MYWFISIGNTLDALNSTLLLCVNLYELSLLKLYELKYFNKFLFTTPAGPTERFLQAIGKWKIGAAIVRRVCASRDGAMCPAWEETRSALGVGGRIAIKVRREQY